MGRAIDMGLRERLLALKQAGYSLSAISEQLHLCYGTVCRLSAQLKTKGDLSVGYANCGAKKPLSDTVLVKASLWLKRLHPLWGAPFIRLQLLQRYTQLKVPAVRTLQHWFRSQGLNKPRQRLSTPRIGGAKAVHNIWQVDAKERFSVLDGTPACYLTITDEHSGAGLAALVFPLWLHLSGARGAGS